MRSALGSAAMLVIFLAGTAAASFVVPAIRAGTTPQKYEYLCVNMHPTTISSDQGKQRFAELGQQGWELATVDTVQNYCFKRPL